MLAFLFECAVAHSENEFKASAGHRADAEDVAVYGAFLDEWLKGSRGRMLLAERVGPPLTEDQWLKSDCLQGVPESIHARSKSSVPIQLAGTLLEARKDVRLVDPDLWRVRDPGTAIAEGEPVDKAVERGMNAGLLTLSEVLFSDDHQVAILGYAFVCGSLCGSGGVVILERKGQHWRQSKKTCQSWIS